MMLGIGGVIGTIHYVGGIWREKEERIENRIKESALAYKEVPTQVQRYWATDTNGDGEIDTILTDSIRNPPSYKHGMYGNRNAYMIRNGDKGFDDLREEILSQSNEEREERELVELDVERK